VIKKNLMRTDARGNIRRTGHAAGKKILHSPIYKEEGKSEKERII
jgi:hypothetical protein